MDVECESQIVEALATVMDGRTALVISHRPSTLELCDRRIDIEAGRLLAPAYVPA
ncbi:MAG TPA: hypothetical protein VE753_06400 [Gaiellaceae bacterium]|nr:hypothetical protein [Gaiellaceae bacterium]